MKHIYDFPITSILVASLWASLQSQWAAASVLCPPSPWNHPSSAQALWYCHTANQIWRQSIIAGDKDNSEAFLNRHFLDPELALFALKWWRRICRSNWLGDDISVTRMKKADPKTKQFFFKKKWNQSNSQSKQTNRGHCDPVQWGGV